MEIKKDLKYERDYIIVNGSIWQQVQKYFEGGPTPTFHIPFCPANPYRSGDQTLRAARPDPWRLDHPLRLQVAHCGHRHPVGANPAPGSLVDAAAPAVLRYHREDDQS